MTDFSFGSDIQVVSTEKRYFLPWDIYNISKITVEENNFKGRNDPSKEYHTLRVRFENEDAYYDENVFYPTSDDDFKDQEREDSNGRKYKLPSRFTQIKVFMGQVMQNVNPDGFAKFCAASSKFKSFEALAKAFMQVVNSAGDVDLQLKLCGRNQQDGSVFACLPNYVGFRSDGTQYASNFLGNSLFFTSKEEAKREIYKNAKPTQMPDIPVNDLTSTSSNEEMKVEDIDNLDDILNSLQ